MKKLSLKEEITDLNLSQKSYHKNSKKNYI